MLTIVGYSLNDTVVIYDRVRENLRRYKAMPLDQLLDRTINETLARTLMTSLTTLLALIALWLFGGEVIRGFTIIMIWGVVIGTYSTIYIATPVLYYLNLRTAAREGPAGGCTSRRADGPADGGADSPQFAPGLQLVQAYRAGRLHHRRGAVTPARSWSSPTGCCPGPSRRRRSSTRLASQPCARPSRRRTSWSSVRALSSCRFPAALRAGGAGLGAGDRGHGDAGRVPHLQRAAGRGPPGAARGPDRAAAARRFRRCCGSGRPPVAARPAASRG